MRLWRWAIAGASILSEAPRHTSQIRISAGPAATRLISLDVFRGLSIAAMILVNNPGTWGHVYGPLEHARWNGWTPTDLIFPFFLFIIGVSMVLSFTSRMAKGATPASLAVHVVRRSAIIFAIGLFMAGFPYFHLSRIRIPGILQRIAVCYLVAGLVVLLARLADRWLPSESGGNRTRARNAVVTVSAIIVLLLAGYWALMRFVPVPGYGAGRLDAEGNLGAYIDRKVLGSHLWQQSKTWDPEGILSTVPAIASMLIGALVGVWLRSQRRPQLKAASMLAAGAAGLVIGEALHPFFPINKNLWTSTYVIFTGGFATVLLAGIYWLVDIKGIRRWTTPLLVYGMNALAVFTFSGLLAKATFIWHVKRADGRVVTWHGYIYDKLFAPLASPVNASLLFAVFYVLLWLGLMWILYRKRIFIKI